VLSHFVLNFNRMSSQFLPQNQTAPTLSSYFFKLTSL